jgi:predicted metalloprotease with PDZ domain
MTSIVSYRVSMLRPHTRCFEVEAQFPACGAEVVVALPVWTPGSYLVREYSRHIQEMTVCDMNGSTVAFERLDKRALKVSAFEKPFVLKYRVYANELTVRTSHLDSSHGYFNGACLFFYVESLRQLPHHVTIEAPKNWKTTTPLNQVGESFVASDFDELVDSPFEVSEATPLSFRAAGVVHEVVMWGDPQLDDKKLVSDLTRVIEAESAMMGPLPLKRYVFFIYGTDKGRGGLEHKASTALLYPRTGFQSPKGWEDFMNLCAHEYFHLWNIKRIKPKRLVPFDYSKENYTELLWFFEGGTSYYDNVLIRRAGILSAPRYLNRLGEALTALQGTPGRKVQSLVESSSLTWTKYYRQDENSPNSLISYYLKGEIVCALLDLQIRKNTDQKKSLDDVMRLLWKRFGDESGVPENGIEAAAIEIGGPSLTAFFDLALRSTQELDYSIFSLVGLEAKCRVRESNADKGGTPPRHKGEKTMGYLGLVVRSGSNITSVLEGSPAQLAGVCADDDVVALDGYKCDANTLVSRCEDKKPGDVVTVTFFRREKLIQTVITLGQKPLDALYLAKIDNASAAQKTAYRAWLGADFDEVETKPT